MARNSLDELFEQLVVGPVGSVRRIRRGGDTLQGFAKLHGFVFAWLNLHA
jgi:hypothetical protein